MTKKIFAMFLAVLMVVSMLPTSVFAAEACPGENKAHSLKNCTDYTEVDHKDADCGNQGYTTYKCNECDAIFIDSWVAATGDHTMVPATEEDNKPAYCGVKGHKGGMICEVCGHTEGGEDIPAIGVEGVTQHEFPAWEVVEHDCKQPITLTRTCKNCPKEEKYEYKATQGNPLPTAHNYGEWKVETAATETATGLAVRECQAYGMKDGVKVWECNCTETQAIFFSHNHDASTLQPVDEVAAKCEVAGVLAHLECRICGLLFQQSGASYEEVEAEDLVIPSLHDVIREGLDCRTTTALHTGTGACGQVVRVNAAAAHTYGNWVVNPAPTCETDGFQKKTCTVCGDTKTEVVPALGHVDVKVSVDATCAAFAYDYTFCARGCNRSVSVTIPTGESAAEYAMKKPVLSAAAIAKETGFYLYMSQTNDFVQKGLYFAGALNGNALATTTDYQAAVKVFAEEVKVSGAVVGYNLFFMNGEEKVYIYVEASVNADEEVVGAIKFADEAPETYFVQNGGKLKTTVEYAEDQTATFVLGASEQGETIGAYAEVAYAANLNSATFVDTIVRDYTINKAAGKDADNHTLVDYYRYEATCVVTGVLVEKCTKCAYFTAEQILPVKEHVYVKSGTEATCTTAGDLTYTCVCGHSYNEKPAALGHTADKYAADVKDENGVVIHKKGDVIVYTTEGTHLNTVIYDYNTCSKCVAEGAAPVVFNKTNYRVWAGAATIWEDVAAAQAAHPNCNLTTNPAHTCGWTLVGTTEGTCTADGYKTYTCNCCGNAVLVAEHDTEGQHWATASKKHEDVIVPATCTTGAYYKTYTCVNCDEKIGTGTVGTTKNYVSEALGHDIVENPAYVNLPCETPDYNMWVEKCSRCDYQLFDFTAKPSSALGGYICEAATFEFYFCRECNETHMRNAIGNIGHDWVVADKDALKAKNPAGIEFKDNGDAIVKKNATCTAAGYEWKYCSICDKYEKQPIAQLKHKNAAGVEFDLLCLDKDFDRHCVLCCAASCKNADGSLKHNCYNPTNKTNPNQITPCACVKPADVHTDRVVRVDATCDTLPYHYEYCTTCYRTTAAEFDTKVGTQAIELKHVPVLADAEQYAAYTYVKGDKLEMVYFYKYNETTGVLEAIPAIDPNATYKFIAYKPATVAEAGYVEFECAVCGIIHKEGVTADELSFSAEIAEGEYTYGSLVEVVISVNGIEKLMDQFAFKVQATGMVFVTADAPMTLDFAVIAMADEANPNVAVLGGWNTSNVAIDGEMDLIKLYFRVTNNAKAEAGIKVELVENPAEDCVATYLDAEGEPVEVNAKLGEDDADVRLLMDADNDGRIAFRDIAYIGEMIKNGKYDVTCDFNQNGEIDFEDMLVARDYYVGNIVKEEVIVECLGAEIAEDMGIDYCETHNEVNCDKTHTA